MVTTSHFPSGRWRLGLLFALTTTFCWGTLPIALKIALKGMDAYTLTWYRFVVSGATLSAILGFRGALPSRRALDGRAWLWVTMGTVGLVGNYVLYLEGLDHTTPTVAQTVIQLAPFLLLLGGHFVFRESLTPRQWVGSAVLLLGLLLFFNRRLGSLMSLKETSSFGVWLVVLAAFVWTAYGLVQKELLQHIGSQQILWLMYVGATFLLLPFAEPGELGALDGWGLGALAYCCANTLVGYGAFAAAFEHWEVSRVSAVVALSPLITVLSTRIAAWASAGAFEEDHLNASSIFGTMVVVVGSTLCAMRSRKTVLPCTNSALPVHGPRKETPDSWEYSKPVVR